MSPSEQAVASPPRSTRGQRLDDVLLDREIGALRLVIILRIIFVSSTVLSTVFIGKSGLEKMTTGALSLLAIGQAPIFFWLLSKRRSVTFVGVVGLATDIVFITALPFIWYFSVGGDSVLPAYMVKHPNTVLIGIALMVGHSVSGRPAYPLAMTLGLLGQYAAVITYAVRDPRTVFSSDFIAHMTGPSISLELLVPCLFSLGAAGGLLTWIAYRTAHNLHDAVEQEMAGAALSRYFSPGTQREILRQAADPLGQRAERQDIAVLFTDLRGFTALSEGAPPEDVMGWLREYHERVVAVVFEHGGTLDKFLGDGMLATFGVPNPTGDEPERAVRAALGIRIALAELNESRVARGLPEFKQGCGVHFGPAIVGNVGVPERLEYTVIGDTVNVASRLEGLCKQLHHKLLLSKEVHDRLPPDLSREFRHIGLHSVRGRHAAIELFTPTGDERTGQWAPVGDHENTVLLSGEHPVADEE